VHGVGPLFGVEPGGPAVSDSAGGLGRLAQSYLTRLGMWRSPAVLSTSLVVVGSGCRQRISGFLKFGLPIDGIALGHEVMCKVKHLRTLTLQAWNCPVVDG
jgi:hypothetical protein